MSRPTREESIYQVSIHRNGGYMYASTHPYTTDEKTGRRKYVNLHWGTVEDGNRFIPGKRYIFASPEERARLVFPKDWDLSEANKLSGACCLFPASENSVANYGLSADAGPKRVHICYCHSGILCYICWTSIKEQISLMEEKKKYFLFADECGDSNLSVYEKSFPVFTLCGIIVSRVQIRKLERDVKALKERIWGTSDIILHSYEIRHLKKAYLPLKDKAVKQDFYKGLDRILGENGAYIIVSSTVLKDDYTRKYGKLGDIYSQALTFLLERAVFYVDDANPEVGGTIDAMLERRGKVEDKKLSERYNELREKGTYWVTPERMKDRMGKLEFVPKAANIVGLQVADLIAYPIACHIMWPERPNPAYDIIKGNIYVSDGKELGIKVIK